MADEAWYGGGCDLTPFYLDEQDTRAFHTYWKDVCDGHKAGLYGELKTWCDKCVVKLGAGMNTKHGQGYCRRLGRAMARGVHKGLWRVAEGCA